MGAAAPARFSDSSLQNVVTDFDGEGKQANFRLLSFGGFGISIRAHTSFCGGQCVGLIKPMNGDSPRHEGIELLRRIGAKDRAALAEFYDKYATLLFSIAFKILNNSPEAEDVLQEAFVQIWEKAGDFDSNLGKPLGWAITLVRNRAIDRIRASRRRDILTQEAGAEFAIATELSETANETVHGHEKSKLIHSAIVELPAEQRRAIELAFFSGLTQNEISEKLNEPLGTVKARIRRGLLKLREQLEGVL
jgi:RNA polymerase sigma-70 factor (ECF subfamily)